MSLTIGSRIAVYGPSGSGKSTVARTLGGLLHVPVVELDALYHLPGWRERPVEEFRAIVGSTLGGYAGGWVCDGNYALVRDLVLPTADTVVWLRLPFRVVYWRLLRRTVTRSWRREELWSGNRESFRMSFLSRDSILLWGLTHWRAHVRGVGHDLATIQHAAVVIELRSPREVDSFLAALATGHARSASWTR